MRLRSVRIENYRVHRALRIEFAPDLTVVAGPNESGKSTIVEAMHRVLFWRAKGTSEELRAMTSIHGGTPEVSLAFESGGKECRITKSFGKAGQTRLEVAGEPLLQGERAEERLAQLVPGAAGPEDFSRKDAAAAFGHLWVWQGTSGNDPLVAIGTERSRLIQRLQTLDAETTVALVASPRDVAAHQRVKAALTELVQANGKPRKDSPVARAEQDLREADAALAEVTALRARLAADERELETGLGLVRAASDQILDLEGRLEGNARALERVAALEAALEEPRRELLRCESELLALDATEREIATLERELRKLETERAHALRSVAQARSAVTDAERRSADAAATRRNTEIVLQAREPQVALLDAHGAVLRAVAHRTELERRDVAIEAERARAEELAGSLARLGAFTRQALADLRRKHDRVRQADAECSARALWIEASAGGSPVTADGSVLPQGRAVRFTATTTLVMADGTTLRITPGSASDLTAALEARDAATRDLAAALSALGVSDLEVAEVRCVERESVARDLAAATTLVERLGAPGIAAELAAARRRVEESAARVDALAKDGAATLPATVAETDHALAAARSAYEIAREAAELARRSHEAARTELDRLRADERRSSDLTSELDRRADPLRGMLEVHLTKQGDAERRAERRARLGERRSSVHALVVRQEAELLAAEPEALRADRERLTAALALRREERSRSQVRCAELRATLGAETQGESLEARLAFAAARRERCDRTLAAARLRVEALTLLSESFAAAAAAVADRFKRPLENAIAGYLGAAFGPRAALGLAWDAERGTFGEFAGSPVVRPAAELGTFAFADLSTGAREQVAIAVRLALAEVLAPDHGGVLPLVLDDALANSDQERVRGMHRLLQRATKRGVQVLVFTCSPRDYAELPCKQVPLAPARGGEAAASAP